MTKKLDLDGAHFEAWKKGFHDKENPYEHGTLEFEAFMIGYNDRFKRHSTRYGWRSLEREYDVPDDPNIRFKV